MNLPLRLLIENEIYRLDVWANPTNDPRRGIDHVTATSYADVSTRRILRRRGSRYQVPWSSVVRTAWQINPAIAVHMSERFKIPIVRAEVGRLVRSNTVEVLDVPEALPFFVEERTNTSFHRDLKVGFLALTNSHSNTQRLAATSMGACASCGRNHVLRT